MFVTERTYDIDELVRFNMHTHSINSLCSGREMTLEAMIKAAEKAGLEAIAITDHDDPGSSIDVLSNSLLYKEQLKKTDTPVKVYIGAELSAYGIGKYADSDALNSALDFRSYSCTHYHLETWEQPEDRSPRGYAEHMLRVASSIIDSGRADCLAHPFSPLKLKWFDAAEKQEVLDSITDNELGDIMEKAEKNGVAWELHQGNINFSPSFTRRLFFTGKENGSHFSVGTDAHHLENISTAAVREALERILK